MTNDVKRSAISIEGLVVTRGGKTVLPGLHLQIPEGELVGLLGPSGSGKSTLMRSIVGSQIVAGGTVTVLGLPSHARELRARVGYVTQSPSVYPDLTVRENLQYFGALVSAPPTAVADTIATVNLEDQAGQLVGTLSGGQASRVSLAAALLGKPDLLVLDEPTVGLDPVLRNELWSVFRSLADQGVTLLVSSHVMDEATRCDRLIFMRDGHVLADGSLDQITARTQTHTAEEAFLALAAQESTP
jgi:ABC-2 type transport system ATP-binding protein